MVSSSTTTTTTTTIPFSSPFAAYCPANDDEESSNVFPSSSSFLLPDDYTPPPWMAVWQQYLVQPFRHNNHETKNALISDWMHGEDPTGYALSVVASWFVLTGLLLVWMLLILVLLLILKCCKRRRCRLNMMSQQQQQEQIGGSGGGGGGGNNMIRVLDNHPPPPPPHRLLLQTQELAPSNDDEKEDDHDHEKKIAQGQDRSKQEIKVPDDIVVDDEVTLLQPQHNISALTHHEFPSAMETSTLQIEQRLLLLETSMVSALSELEQQQTMLSLHYLNYCNNTPPSNTTNNDIPNHTSQSDRESSIDLLKDSRSSSSSSSSISTTSSSGITSSRTTPPKAKNNTMFAVPSSKHSGNVSYLEESPMRQQILDVTEDGHVTVMNDNNNNNNNITTATLEDVLRNVYLDDENKVPEALSVDSNDNNNVSNGIGLVDHDSIENNDDETFSLAANRMTYPMHPHFQSTQDQTNIHELSTIVPSLSTSFDTTTNSIPIADAADEENHILFFQDDDDDDDEDDSDGNLPRHSFSVPAHLPSTSSLTRKANAASQTINSGSPPSTSQLPPLTMASASSIIRHRKRLLEQYVQSFRANNAATTTTMPEQGTSTATTSQKATQTQTPETSPTSTIGRNLEESGSSSAAYVFHDEPSSHDHNGNAQDGTRSNIAVVETIDTPAAAVDKKENKRVNFAASADQSMHRQRRQSPQSWCVDTLSPMMVLAACTILIVAVILFGMNGVWALQLQTQQTEVAWERLAHHFLQDVPASLDELQDLQRSVLQQIWNVWQSLDSNCPKRQGKICNGEFNQPTAEAINAFWQDTNTSVECQLEGLPLFEEWAEWSSVAQPMVMKNLTSSQDALFRGQDSAVEFWDNLDQSIQGTYEPLWDWTLYVAMAANICLALLSFGIMWMIAVPAQNSRARRRLDAPFCWCNRRTFSMLFWIVVVLAWIFGLWFSVGTVLTSDTCGKIDTPNALASELLQRWASSHPSSEPLLARWMIAFQKQDCVSVLSQAELNSTPWLQLVEPTHRLSTALQALPPNIYFDVCGTALWPLQDSLDRLSERLCDFTSALQLDSHRNDECGSAIASWYPDFASIMVDSICDQGSKALVWVTATQALILCMIMVVWTCRSAFLPEQVEKEKEERGNSCCCRCSCRPSFSCGLMQRLKSQSFSHQWYLSKNASSYSHHSSIGSSSEDEEQRNHAQDGYVQP